MTVVDDYYNCAVHGDDTACDVAGSAFSSGGATWAASFFFAFSRNAQRLLLNRAETAAGAETARAELLAARKAGELGKRRAGLGATLRFGDGQPEVLKAFSGATKAQRKGWVPDVGTSGNPQRYNPTSTGRNARDNDTEYKMLTYIANRLGEPSNVSGSLTLVSTQQACFSCTPVIGQFAKEFPNIRINYEQME
ncbi:deaminase domain-containing protein [Streptomyces sp. DSM 41529]|uniref:Deaminase domain-containing protein n=2 Tax=Streptomyces TaxID=1883 RepID=A0ABU2XQ73_9ACTN|nr:deaminase domain-containing protein [Streptomyces sp. DSM 41529]MDT0546973.1 deaminase domain-containing protein [Streptomyces sp. DSM 41529]